MKHVLTLISLAVDARTHNERLAILIVLLHLLQKE